MRSPQDTIAAIATPLGEGGLGVIRISGAAALSVAAKVFRGRGHTGPTAALTHSCHVGQCIDGATVLDHVVLTIFRAPQSYTGEDVAEISAHGSPVILEAILRSCLRAGARLSEPGEFTERAFLNGKIDLTQAEAVVDLIQAKTEKARAAAFGQLQGQLSRQVRAIRDQLLPLLAHVEVGLDHSDDGHEFIDRARLVKDCEAVQQRLDAVLASARVGGLLRQGLRVALVGRPNVGKSSLLNALLKSDRAIVSPIAGTTRDTLEETVNWDGWPVVLTDTAGLRADARDPLEAMGMERSRAALASSDLLLGLLDSSTPLDPDDLALVRDCQTQAHLWVRTKADLASAWPVADLHALNGQAAVVSVSAVSGAGIADLVEMVKLWAEGAPASATAAEWMLNTRHRDALERARAALQRAGAAASDEAYEECVALELQSALAALGEIIGETATDDLLAQIFKQFCVGK